MSLLGKLANKKRMMNQYRAAAEDHAVLAGERLRKLQLCELEMFKDIMRVCQAYEIPVFLCGGSALGAVRHQGFIPWDDDLDVSMARKDYVRFQAVFEKELSEKYILNAPNYSEKPIARFPKVLLRDSVLKSGGRLEPEQQKVFVDIFIIDNLPDNRLIRRVKGIWCNLAEWIGGQVQTYESADEQTRKCLRSAGMIYYSIITAVGFLCSFMNGYRWNDLVDRCVRHKNEQSRSCAITTGRKHYFGESLERTEIFPGQSMTFEGENVLVFNNVRHYLEKMYGDYMQIPPEEKREKHGFIELRLPGESVQPGEG